MSTANNPTHTSVPTSRAPSMAASHPQAESAYTNGDVHSHNEPAMAQRTGSANSSKKLKQKKATDPNEASKLIAAKISQLELGKAEEKDQEAEIGWF
jgi:hypothetical protein